METTAESLDSGELARALTAGVYRLLGAQERLDRINVFPVPDGDTGTNLAATASALLPVLQRPPSHAGELLAAVADAALDGARGNSGAIFAQWFLGLADGLADAVAVGRRDFAAALACGARYARVALSEPRDGTILTVLADVATAVAGAADVLRFPALCAHAIGEARRSLEATRHGLDVLVRADVVDAGAAGFVAFLEGFGTYLEDGILAAVDGLATTTAPALEAAGSEAHLDHRWCTECVVTGCVDPATLREQLAGLGSSLVVAGSSRKARIHIHVAEPASVFRVAAQHGLVSGEKADDMQRQQESTAHAGRRPVAVVTDSAADLPDDLLESLDIHVVPVRLSFGTTSYLDKVSLSPQALYAQLATNPLAPKTSQPPPGDFRRLYEFLCSHHTQVVSVHVSSRLSGTLQSADAAANRSRSAERIRLVDSRTASAGQGLLVIHAAQCADRGLDAAAIAASVDALRERTQTWAWLPTLDYAVRGGRVPALVQRLARWLHVAPLLMAAANGRLGLGGILLGRGQPVAKFAAFVSRRLPRGQRYRLLVAHGADEAAAAHFEACLRQRHDGIAECYRVASGAALGVHGGPGFLAVAAHPLEDTAPDG